ncbi:MAG TPA: hypothetical protein VJR02_27200, partial [Pyrinomonadaceae bacterium]|nr:hypothetical protein [Pyrinomonadaceae bacterium]
MNVIRIDDSADFLEAPGTTSSTGYNTFEPWVILTEDVPVHGLLICANAGKASRARRLGLRWLQKFRRERRSMAPALVYSFETRNALARDFSFLEPGMPGVDYLQLPYVCQNIENRLTAIPPMTADQLGEFIRWHSGLQQDWRKSAHDLVGSLRNWPEQQALSKRLLEGWAISVRKYAQDQFWLLERLENMIGESGSRVSTQKEIGPMIKMLEENLCI